MKFINTSKAFYSYIGTLKISSAKYWKYVQGCAKEKNIEFLYEVGKDTNEDNENDDHDIKDQNVCGDGAKSDDDGSDYDDCNATESEELPESVEDLSIVEFNSIEIKERFINVNILYSS